MRLKDRVAIVSGGGSMGPSLSNGRATSIVFAREGAKVVVVDQNFASAEETVGMIKDEGGEAIAVAADVTADKEVRSMVETAVAKYGCVNVLFNNVGATWGTDLVYTSEEDWDRTFSACLKSIFLVSKHVVPEMRKIGGGAIVNNASSAAFHYVDWWAYTTAKAGVVKLTKDMAYKYGRENIRVNCVVPGWIDTALRRRRFGGGEEGAKIGAEKARELVPLGRQGTPWEVANAVLFLASDEASYCNGTSIFVDGGLLSH